MTAFSLALRGNLRATIRNDLDGLDQAIDGAVRETTRSLQQAGRNRVNRLFGSGRGSRGRNRRRVGNAIRRREYRDGRFQTAGLVYSRFGRKEGGRFVDYLLPHTRGATITAKSGKWLFISNERGKRRNRRLIAAFAKNIVFINTKPGVALLVRKTRTRSTILGVLIRRVRIRKRLDFEADKERARRQLPERVLDRWD